MGGWEAGGPERLIRIAQDAHFLVFWCRLFCLKLAGHAAAEHCRHLHSPALCDIVAIVTYCY